MENYTPFKIEKIISAFIFALGIALAGYFMGNSLLKSRLLDRSVVVKGLSERIVNADLAIWPITIKATGNDLVELNRKIESDRNSLINFLVENGFSKDDEIEIGNYNVTDLFAQVYRNNNLSEEYRYIIDASIILQTNNIGLVKKIAQLQNLLVQKGIVLAQGSEGPVYEFTKFNDIKVEMIEESIKNARKSAEKFAQDSGNEIGVLRKANQGIFVIRAAIGGDTTDEYKNLCAEKKSINKKIRVVTTLEYFLKD